MRPSTLTLRGYLKQLSPQGFTSVIVSLQAGQIFDVIVCSVAQRFANRCDLFEHVQKHLVIEQSVVRFADGRLSEQIE